MGPTGNQPLDVTFGVPQEWDAFKRRHSLFLQRFSNLEAALRIAFERTQGGTNQLDRVIYFSGRLCAEEFSEILLLCGNGYGVAALRLVRGMYERAVTARYLSEHPEEIEAFLEFYWISQHKLMKAIEETFGDLIGKEKTAEAKENFERVKERFAVTSCDKCGTTRTNYTWNKLNFVAMARKTGELGKLIVPAYYLPTKEAHSTIGAILSRLERETGDGLIFDSGPQRERADEALISAHNLILNALELQRDYFKLQELHTPVQTCYSDFMEIWGTPKENIH